MALGALGFSHPAQWRRGASLLAACALAQSQPQTVAGSTVAGTTTCLPPRTAFTTYTTRASVPRYCTASGTRARRKPRLGGSAGDAEDYDDGDSGSDAGDGGGSSFGNWGGRWDGWGFEGPEGEEGAPRRAFPAWLWLEYGLAKALGLWHVLCVFSLVQAALFLAPATLHVLCTGLLPLSLLGLTQRTLPLNPAFCRL